MIITINNKPFPAPELWNDLSKEQILEMCRIFLNSRKDTSLTSLKIQLSTVILNIEKRFWRDLEQDVKDVEGDDYEAVFNAEVSALIQITKYFLDDQYHFYPNFTLTKNNFYKVKNLYGPLDKMKNITFGEWAFMDMLYIKYVTTEKEEILNTLIAALWRPSKPKTRINKQRHYDGDRRVELMVHETVLFEYAEKHIAKWDKALKYACFVFIASSRKAIINRYPYLFKKSEAGEAAAAASAPTDYADIILKLAGDKFGDDEKVFNKNTHTILKYLNGLEKVRLDKK